MAVQRCIQCLSNSSPSLTLHTAHTLCSPTHTTPTSHCPHTMHSHTLLTLHTAHTCSVSEERYQAFRSTIYRNASTIPLNETGPLLNFRVSARNTREASNGTGFPRTTLLIHIPVEQRDFPLLVPTEVVVTTGTVNCSHYEAIPRGLVSVHVLVQCFYFLDET